MNYWICPKCGHTEAQPVSVRVVSHRCPATRKVVDLVKEERTP